MTTRRYTKEETAEATGRLRSELTPGRTIFTKLTHVSRSGMSRSIECYLAQGRDNLTDITWLVARATNSRVDNTHGGIVMGGCPCLVLGSTRLSVTYPSGRRGSVW